MTRARVFLERSQNPDGGFFFAPVTPALNKAGQSAEGFVSYGTTTADGVLALRASGVPDSDDRIGRALAWLDRNHQPDGVPGFDEAEGSQASWGRSDSVSTTPPRSHASGLASAFDCLSRQRWQFSQRQRPCEGGRSADCDDVRHPDDHPRWKLTGGFLNRFSPRGRATEPGHGMDLPPLALATERLTCLCSHTDC